MPGLTEFVTARPVSAFGLLAGVVAFPILFPSARPQWAAAVKGGVKLFLDAQDEAEAGIIEDLVDDAVDDLVKARSRPDPKARAQGAEAAVRRFQHRAKWRSDRRGRDDDDRRRRYARHMDALERRLSRRSAAERPDRRDVWEHALSVLGGAAEPPHGAAREAPEGAPARPAPSEPTRAPAEAAR